MTPEDLHTLKQFDRIPAEGYLLAVFRDRVLLERYRKEADGLIFHGSDSLQSEELQRLHCFDRDTEYRLLAADDGDRLIEVVLDAEEEKAMEPDLLFEDEMLLRPEYCTDRVGIRKLKVINLFRYTEFDTMTLDNYRITF